VIDVPPYVQRMPTKTLRLAHAELCSECADLLPIGTTIVVDEGRRATCLSCAPDDMTNVVGFARNDPWTWVADGDLRELLHHRVPSVPHRLAVSA
jgi:hypothetical protein